MQLQAFSIDFVINPRRTTIINPYSNEREHVALVAAGAEQVIDDQITPISESNHKREAGFK